jgi:hypothetical protein
LREGFLAILLPGSRPPRWRPSFRPLDAGGGDQMTIAQVGRALPSINIKKTA